MQANCCTNQNATFNGSPNAWVATGSVQQPSNDESGFTLLTNGKVFTVDAKADLNCGTSTGSELYNPTTGVWSYGPNTPVQLYASDEELGAAVLMYNNKVFQSVGNVNATTVYNVSTNTWSKGPTPANGLDQTDGPSALEPNGKLLAMYSPGLFHATSVEHDLMAGKSIQNLIKYFSVVQMSHPVREHFFDNLQAIEFSHQPPRFLFRDPSMPTVGRFSNKHHSHITSVLRRLFLVSGIAEPLVV